MKKIIYLIILFLIFGVNVKASEIYYTEYGEFSDFMEESPNHSDLINVEEETRYLWYKNIEVLGDYKLYNKSDKFSDECYESDYSNWKAGDYVKTDGRTYETRTKYEYEQIQGIRYIHLYNLYGSYGAFRIPELSIYVNGVEINYTYECIGCWKDFDKYINNNEYIENESYIDNGGSLILDLGKLYPIDQIKVEFYIFDLGYDDKQFTIGYSDGASILFSKSYKLQFSDYYWTNSQKIELKIQDIESNESYWKSKQIVYHEEQNELFRLLNKETEYRYKEKWCKEKITTKIYGKNYSKEAYDDFINCDKEKFKKFFRFQTREKIELEIYDILEKNFDLNKFVVFSSAPYMIEADINWDENGTYNLDFKFEDITIQKVVNLNVEANTIDKLEERINQLQELIVSLENQFISQRQDYETQVLDLENQINLLKQSLNNCENDCVYEKNCLKEIIENNERQLKLYEDKLLQLSNNINDSQIELENKKEEIELLKLEKEQNLSQINVLEEKLNGLIKKNEELNQLISEEYIKKIEDLNNLNKKYASMLEKVQIDLDNSQKENEANKLLNEEKQNKIVALEKLNKIYENKITELEEDLRLVNASINVVAKQKDELVNKYKSEVASLSLQIENMNLEYEKLTMDYKNIQEEQALMNVKYNNYILKIRNGNITFAGIGIFLIIIIVLTIYILIRKKSNEKKV